MGATKFLGAMALAAAFGHHVELLQVAHRRAAEEVLAEPKLGHADATRSGEQEDAEIPRDVLANATREKLGPWGVLVELDLKAV